MPATPSASPSASAPASISAPDRHSVHALALKLPEFWADNAHVWFAQTEAQFATRGITCRETKFYFCVAALGRADAAHVVDLIEYPPDQLSYEFLKERLTELYTLNPFQRYQEFMSLTLAADEKPSKLIGKMLSLLPQRSHSIETWLVQFESQFIEKAVLGRDNWKP